MSYRSALNNPLPNSGNVGLIVNDGFGAVSQPIFNGQIATIQSLNLSAGLWNINLACLVGVSNGTTISSLVETLVVNGVDTIREVLGINVIPDSADTSYSYQNSYSLSLTVPSLVVFQLLPNFTGGSGMTASLPLTSSGRPITATKLA